MDRKKSFMIAVPVLVALGVAAAVFLRPGREEGKEPKPIDPPMEYVVGSVALPALPVFGDGIAVYKDALQLPAGVGDGSASEETSSQEQEMVEAVQYRYEGLRDARQLVAAYTALMDTDDTGFCVVDQDLHPIETPDLETPEGEVRIARPGIEEGSVISIQLQWASERCAVTLSAPKGQIQELEPPEPMTYAEMSDYVDHLAPAALGLGGASMEDYNVYIMDGIVMVDQNPCAQVKVYRDDGRAGTNEVEGNYLISVDRKHIYRLDVKTGTVSELPRLR